MGIILGFLRALKLPVKLLKGWLRKRRTKSAIAKRNTKEGKLRQYVYNFSPGRLKNVS
jgi:hypothetical protein